MEIPKGTRIIIIEGIPGSGKTTVHSQLKEVLRDKLVYDFSEEELLFGWKHAWIKDIEKIRLEFMNRLLDYCEKILDKNSNAVFIFNRFHISFNVLAVKIDSDTSEKYRQLINRLRKMQVYIYVPILDEHRIEERSSHQERKEEIWKLHLKKRLETRGFSSLKEMYTWEQNRILELLKEQNIPYSILKVEL